NEPERSRPDGGPLALTPGDLAQCLDAGQVLGLKSRVPPSSADLFDQHRPVQHGTQGQGSSEDLPSPFPLGSLDRQRRRAIESPPPHPGLRRGIRRGRATLPYPFAFSATFSRKRLFVTMKRS